tara:strand:+ start:60 stop:725 length:666 start_codon:yes stop_codon:yes gene_type:complete
MCFHLLFALGSGPFLLLYLPPVSHCLGSSDLLIGLLVSSGKFLIGLIMCIGLFGLSTFDGSFTLNFGLCGVLIGFLVLISFSRLSCSNLLQFLFLQGSFSGISLGLGISSSLCSFGNCSLSCCRFRSSNFICNSLLFYSNLGSGNLVSLSFFDGEASLVGNNSAVMAVWVVVDLTGVIIVFPEWLVTDASTWAFSCSLFLFDLGSFHSGSSEEKHFDNEFH